MVVLLHVPSQEAAWAAFVVFILSALSDWLDGYLARRMNSVSNFGKLIDALTDKILVLGLFVALLGLDILPNWSVLCILLILCREFLVTGLRLVAASRGMVLAAEKLGKWKTAAQLVSIGVLLFRNGLAPAFSATTSGFASFAYFLGIVSFLAATALTVHSGYYYVRKYWDVFTEDA